MALKLTTYQRKLFKLIAGGLLYTVCMIIGAYLLGLFVDDNQAIIPIYLMIIMLVMVMVYVYRVIIAKRKEKLLFMRYGTLITWFTLLAVFSILIYVNPGFVYVVCIGYALGLIIDRIYSLFHAHRGRNIFLAVVIFLYATLLIIAFLTPLSEEFTGGGMVFALVPLTLIYTSFIDAIKLVFSGLRKQTLMQIIKKTYTIEILYGLITLMVAISIILLVTEEGFNNYGDALWYCFAVVTTIGFGDFTVSTFLGRVLTVILGIYGIIVVALITSIIVNFYNESNPHKDEKISEIVKELEEQREQKEEDKEDK